MNHLKMNLIQNLQKICYQIIKIQEIQKQKIKETK